MVLPQHRLLSCLSAFDTIALTSYAVSEDFDEPSAGNGHGDPAQTQRTMSSLPDSSSGQNENVANAPRREDVLGEFSLRIMGEMRTTSSFYPPFTLHTTKTDVMKTPTFQYRSRHLPVATAVPAKIPRLRRIQEMAVKKEIRRV